MKYYPFQKNWHKIKPYLQDSEVQKILNRDFSKYVKGRTANFTPKTFKKDEVPADYDSCDWRIMSERRGKHPAYWNYVCHGACHWTVNFYLILAQKVEPRKEWRIVNSDNHSLVWDGEETLFDLQFSAIGVDPDEGFKLARENGRVLKPGKKIGVYQPVFS